MALYANLRMPRWRVVQSGTVTRIAWLHYIAEVLSPPRHSWYFFTSSNPPGCVKLYSQSVFCFSFLIYIYISFWLGFSFFFFSLLYVNLSSFSLRLLWNPSSCILLCSNPLSSRMFIFEYLCHRYVTCGSIHFSAFIS